MSDDFIEDEDVACQDDALRRIFFESLASSSTSSSLLSLPSTTSKVYVSTLVDYIRDNASGNYRDETLLDELQTAIEEVSSDGQVNWTMFKEASRRWVDKVRRNRWQDGNNNIEKNDFNDDLLERSDDEKGCSGVVCRNSHFGSLSDRTRKPKTPRRFVTADFVNLSNVSSYSPSSGDTTHGCAMSTDTTPDSADDTDVGSGSSGEVAQVDLRLRVRRFDEENALLREELVRAEELSAEFKRQYENLRRKLDQTNEKCRQLERENDEHKEILHEVEQRERNCKWALQKTEKERSLLDKKLEEAETERQQITCLTSKLEICKREKLDSVREAIVCRQEVEEKQNECEMLKEKLAQIANRNDDLQESYEKTIRHLRQQNEDLKNEIFDLKSKQSSENLTEGICLTPPTSYLHCYTQSTPYSNNKDVQMQDSLYAELKASGFSVDDTANESRIRELEEELSYYNEEIRDAVKQIDDVLEKLNRHRRTPHVPDLHLNGPTIVNTADIYELLQKISKLSNSVNEMIWKPKVKDASSQIYVDSALYAEQRTYSQYGIMSFEDCLRLANVNRARETSDVLGEANERRESSGGFFVEAFSMNSRLLGEYVEEVEVASETESSRETDAFSPSRKESMTAPLGIQEHTIIDPIVEELDRILHCTNKCEEELSILPTNCSPSKNPKHRCIYTCAQPSPDQRVTEANYSTIDSTLNSAERDLAATYVISSGGDGPPVGMVNNNNSLTNGDNTVDQGDSMLKIIPREDSNKCAANTTELMLKSQDINITKLDESEKLSEESFDKKLQDSKISAKNLSSLSPRSAHVESSLPRKDNELSVTENEILANTNAVTFSVTPNKTLRNFPKRKISVFHRSFDINTLQAIGEAGGPDTYRLTERSMSTPDAKQEKNTVDDMELDPDCMKTTQNSRNFLLNTYRTIANDSDSSGSSSPEKSLDYRRINPSIMEIPIKDTKRPIVLAPKLKLPLLNDAARITSENKLRKSSNGDARKEENEDLSVTKSEDKCDVDLTANENHKTYDLSTSDLSATSKINEMIRPGDVVDRGITYRRRSFSRELDLSGYSLLSPAENSTIDNTRDEKLESVSTVVLSDGESTSCDSSPKREPPVVQASIPLLSSYGMPKSGERTYTRQDPSKSRGFWQADRLIEGGGGGGVGYQTRNDSISINSSVGNYGVGGGGNGIRAANEKASVLPAVALAMSSGEDTSDSECDPMAIRGDEDRRNVVDETRSISPTVHPFVNGAFLGSSTPALPPNTGVKNDTLDKRGDSGPRKPLAQKRDKRERLLTIRRSLSESGCGRTETSCQCTAGNSIRAELSKDETQPNAFPSLSNARLQESGIANLSSSDEIGGSLSETDLELKYTAFSVGLVTDRLTLPRRMTLSISQRDQAERNLACEVQKMHQDIQDLAPLCIDRESLERVERVRHQLEMITQCAHRVSCTAETLGAVHQENRISRAILLADRYLVVLRSRCEKLASDLAETKRILTENNIVVEENNGELGDDLPRIRYRGMPTNNRTMMARRRASIATISRPLGNFQDLTKDGVRQRNSVSGRVTLRRPSLSAESQKWELDKLDRTDLILPSSSSSSIGELREIFEQAESRPNSREENNNLLRLHSSNLSIRDSENGETDVWMNTREEPNAVLIPTVNGCQESRIGQRTPHSWIMMYTNVPWKPMLWCIIVSFFLGYYMKHVVTSENECSGTSLRWWSIEELVERYVDTKNDARRPI